MEEDPVFRAEDEGVIQAASGVGALSSSSSVAAAVNVTAAYAVPSRVFVVAAAIGSAAPGGKNGVGGGSSTNRDNDNHDADSNRRHRPCPRRAATAVAMMTMAGDRGGEATVRRLQGNNEVMEM